MFLCSLFPPIISKDVPENNLTWNIKLKFDHPKNIYWNFQTKGVFPFSIQSYFPKNILVFVSLCFYALTFPLRFLKMYTWNIELQLDHPKKNIIKNAFTRIFRFFACLKLSRLNLGSIIQLFYCSISKNSNHSVSGANS